MARESKPARTGLTLALNMKERSQLMHKNLDTRINADIACEEDKNSSPAKDESDPLTLEDLLPVFDITEITKFNQVVCKSFSD